jgi:hypothetical protein
MTGNPMSASEADITTVLNIPFLDRMSTYDDVDGARSAASECQRVVA